MEHNTDPQEYLTSIVQSSPLKLSRFWKSKLLRKHSSEEEFNEDIKLCFGINGNWVAEELTTLLKQKKCYQYFLENQL